jgi:hypothetical protein
MTSYARGPDYVVSTWQGNLAYYLLSAPKLLTLVVGHHASRYDDAMPEQRRLRPPWSVEDRASCFVVKARGGHELAYIYYEDDPRKRSIVKLLSRNEARQVATAIAKLPEDL